ncbi:bmp7 [Acrasis kona]|uniref:Bmp7 n=1 Tax=Acrasis kona TaxID=1008807 RepID=A0AAW2YH66_9EUKA
MFRNTFRFCTSSLIRQHQSTVQPIVREWHKLKAVPGPKIPEKDVVHDRIKLIPKEKAEYLFEKYRWRINKTPLHLLVTVLEEHPGMSAQQLYDKTCEIYPGVFRGKRMFKTDLDKLRLGGYVVVKKNPIAKQLPKNYQGFIYTINWKLKRLIVKQTLLYGLEQEALLEKEKGQQEENKSGEENVDVQEGQQQQQQ